MALFESADDNEFVQALDARFPDNGILQKFKYFLEYPPELRPLAAKRQLGKLPRTGYVRRGLAINQAETVGQHVTGMLEMVDNMSASNVDVRSIADIRKLKTMIEVHDIGEPVVGDFTPADPITRPEKARLERLAVGVIYEGRPLGIGLWDEFEECVTDCAILAGNIDKLQMLQRSLTYRRDHPHLSFQDLIDDVLQRPMINDQVVRYRTLLVQRHE